MKVAGLRQITRLGADLHRAPIIVLGGAQAVTAHHGQLMLTRVRAHASGRPGPRVQEGDYRRSWSLILNHSGTKAEAIAGTNSPQGRRLEHGFVGPDALGRHYNQPPYPHAKPAFDETIPGYVASLQALGFDAITGSRRGSGGRFVTMSDKAIT